MKILLLSLACASLAGCMHRELQPTVQAAADTHLMGHTAEPADTANLQSLRVSLSRDAELGAYALDVDAKEGLVILSGVVASAQARARAEALARALPGVSGVVNDLQVKAA